MAFDPCGQCFGISISIKLQAKIEDATIWYQNFIALDKSTSFLENSTKLRFKLVVVHLNYQVYSSGVDKDDVGRLKLCILWVSLPLNFYIWKVLLVD